MYYFIITNNEPVIKGQFNSPEFLTITSSRFYSLSNDVAERRKRLKVLNRLKFRLQFDKTHEV